MTYAHPKKIVARSHSCMHTISSVFTCVCVCLGALQWLHDDVGGWVTQSSPRDIMNHCTSPPQAELQPSTTLHSSLITTPPSSLPLPLPSPTLLSSLALCLLCSSTLFLCALFYFHQQHLIFFSAVVNLFWLIRFSIIFSPVLTVSFAF